MYISNHFHVSPMFICHFFPKQNNTLKGLFGNPKPFAKNLKHLRGCVLWVILDADGNFHSKNHHHLSIPPNLGGQICCFTFFLLHRKRTVANPRSFSAVDFNQNPAPEMYGKTGRKSWGFQLPFPQLENALSKLNGWFT